MKKLKLDKKALLIGLVVGSLLGFAIVFFLI